jgi:hypothetical protein
MHLVPNALPVHQSFADCAMCVPNPLTGQSVASRLYKRTVPILVGNATLVVSQHVYM